MHPYTQLTALGAALLCQARHADDPHDACRHYLAAADAYRRAADHAAGCAATAQSIADAAATAAERLGELVGK
jgi:hypothetical protein